MIYKSCSSAAVMDPLNPIDEEEEEEEDDSKPSWSTADNYSSRSHSSRRLHRHYVRSWVEEQRQVHQSSLTDSQSEDDHSKPTLPAIIVTDADEGTSMYVDKTPRLPSPSGARRVSIYPSLIEEPILEDHEFEQDAEREEGSAIEMDSFAVRIRSMKSQSEIEEPFVPFERKRAKSYPTEKPNEPSPLIELPPQCQDPEEEIETETNTDLNLVSLGIRKFAHVAVMAKKWKKRSSQEESCLSQTAKESVTDRQKKRQYIEIPRTLQLDIYEEAIPLIQKTYQMYKSCLTPKHKLTILTEQHLQNLTAQVGKKNV